MLLTFPVDLRPIDCGKKEKKTNENNGGAMDNGNAM